MSENYERYNSYDIKKYNKKGLSYYILRRPSDKRIIPLIRQIKQKDVLEVGLGYGYYTEVMLKNRCKIVGVDINPELGKHLNIPIIKGNANNLKDKINDKFDCVISIFMTEYLTKRELENFIFDGLSLLKNNGYLCTTIILRKGLGHIYTLLANIKGIKKYSYSMKEIVQIIEKTDASYELTKVKGIFGISLAILVKINKDYE